MLLNSACICMLQQSLRGASRFRHDYVELVLGKYPSPAKTVWGLWIPHIRESVLDNMIIIIIKLATTSARYVIYV